MDVVRPPDREDRRGASIADVARILGVPMPTLRSWERRYQIPVSTRALGRHRRYLPAEVHAIRLMRDEIARGRAAGVAAQAVHDELNVSGPVAGFVQAILTASDRMDTQAVRAGLDQAREELGLGSCIDDVLLPAMRQVGVWWASGYCDQVQERMTTEAVRAWLDRSSAFTPPPAHAQPIILACGPSDLHTIGLESLALLLRSGGRPCRVLGARTPTVTLVTATQAAFAVAVVVVGHLATGRLRTVASINAVADLDTAVFYAGNAFSSSRSRVKVQGTYLGTRLQDACSMIVESLAPDRGSVEAVQVIRLREF